MAITAEKLKDIPDDLAVLAELRIRLQDMTLDQMEWIKALLQEMECRAEKEKEGNRKSENECACEYMW